MVFPEFPPEFPEPELPLPELVAVPTATFIVKNNEVKDLLKPYAVDTITFNIN